MIDIEFTKDTFDVSFSRICSEVFSNKPVRNGDVIAVLGFADMVHNRYVSSLWYTPAMMINNLANVLEDMEFHPNQLNTSNCIIL